MASADFGGPFAFIDYKTRILSCFPHDVNDITAPASLSGLNIVCRKLIPQMLHQLHLKFRTKFLLGFAALEGSNCVPEVTDPAVLSCQNPTRSLPFCVARVYLPAMALL